jgi:hypothetical protein
MQLIRDNLTLWTSEMQDDAEGEGGEGNPWKEETSLRKLWSDIYIYIYI